MDFPERLASFRKAKKFNQQQLAALAKVHVAQIRRYEYGQSQPTLEVIRNLAIALGVTGDELLFDTNERGAGQELTLQFEAIQKMDNEDLMHVKAVLDGLILRHQAKQWTKAG